MNHAQTLHLTLCGALLLAPATPGDGQTVEANHLVEVGLTSAKTYGNPFVDVLVDVVVTPPAGEPLRLPAFWAGGDRWCFRYASPQPGRHAWRSECSDAANAGLHAATGQITVAPNASPNPLYEHGPVRLAADHRHFAHVDGTPFLWLGDTWWKNLCRRMTWEGFQELTADRAAKGFSVVQIVCGPYPDEGPFEPRWENEGGKPYETHDFGRVNPAYFAYADRRIAHLVQAGLVPAIVGGWGRGDCDGLRLAGVDGLKRHWRHLIARYGAYPTVWIIGGESQGPEWTEVARYVRATDPFHRLATMHPHHSGRDAVTDETVIDFDMLQTGHGDWPAAFGAIPQVRAAYARTPVMPAMIGEYCYEGHMQTAFADVQRYVFWASLLSGSAGLTYGAAGVWHASVEGDPGLANVYDTTTWREGMAYPGSTQLGLGRKLLLAYPWDRFEPHPDWVEEGSFAAGIPGEVRLAYLPKRGVYNWTGPSLKGLERDVPYHAFYFDPVRGRRFEVGRVVNAGPAALPFAGHTLPLAFSDQFQGTDNAAWRDDGTPTQRADGRLLGGKGMVTVLRQPAEADAMASVEANSDAEAGVMLRYHGLDEYLVALYTPSLKAIYLHDRRGGEWGQPLGRVAVPDVGPRIKLTAAACGEYAALVMTDGQRTYCTPIVKVSNTTAGQAGLWMFQIGEQQEYRAFELSRTPFAPPTATTAPPITRLSSGDWQAPKVPSPQDWVLVMERDGR
ncbi:MAG: DUF4038 domain-containing protein [Armatimonadetes bacterium]|nr:DUF4038 domain-containing protein [Armatimonadota bacterium]